MGGAAVLRSATMKRLWNISPPIGFDSPLFPGDEPYTQRWTARIGPDCPVNLSAITMSPHIGAHADAPLHYGDDQPTIGEIELTPYLGRCRVIHAIGPARLIRPADLEAAAEGPPPRVPGPRGGGGPPEWSAAFSPFAPPAV